MGTQVHTEAGQREGARRSPGTSLGMPRTGGSRCGREAGLARALDLGFRPPGERAGTGLVDAYSDPGLAVAAGQARGEWSGPAADRVLRGLRDPPG